VSHLQGFRRLQKNSSYFFLLLLLCGTAAFSQTTQGLISGRLLNSVTGRPIDGATVGFTSATSNLAGASPADANGYYYLPLLSPGFYRIRVTAPNFQSQEVQELELTVAARVELDFRLRPLSDVWESGEYKSVFLPGQKTIVTFYGPDVDSSKSGSFDAQKGRTGALESTISEVIDSGQINNLPLQGRDVYTMLVTQPGVTSDAATGRGLGLAVNGQRPSASNYLLDGVENNNYLITGPLTVVAPEAIQEYRISTNNFSAEYGRTSGFVANAITRAGGDRFHGVGYFYLKNETLNANDFQLNRLGIARVPAKEDQPGFFVGGPILKNRLYFSSAYEYFRSRSQQAPFTFLFPGAGLISGFTLPTALSRQLLAQFPAPVTSSPSALTVQATLSPPVAVNRTLAIERVDYSRPDGKDRVMGRVLINRFEEPDFIWSPYKDFISVLNQNTTAVGINYVHSFLSNLTNEARLSFSNDDLHWNRPHPEIPTLVTSDVYTAANGTLQSGAALPGSPAFYAYKNVNRSWELLDNAIWTRGQHLITAGAGLLLRSSDGYLTAGRDGEYQFNNVISFAVDAPSVLRAAIDRTALQTTPTGFSVPSSVQLPGFDRTFGYHQFFLFAQDTYKITRRLTANYGVRYEYFGGPQNTGSTKDGLVQLGSGSTLAQQLVGATLVKPTGSGNQQLFGSDPGDFAVRAGVSYDLFGTGRTVLRGAYGIFYDRPFDNLWENIRNNDVVVPPSLRLTLTSGRFNYLAPISTVFSSLPSQVINTDFPEVTLVDPNLKNGRVQSYFVGVQHRVAENLTVEVNGLGTYGRRLITTDVVNRAFSTINGRINNSLPDVAYRSGQGFSDYNALTALVRYHNSHGMVQASYTWSHTIDNQSDPLAGDFFDLKFTSIAGSYGSTGRASFSEQFNPFADRGNSDFDQRHNFVVFSHWTLPAPFARSKFGFLFRDWTVSELAAFRSGFPYSVGGPTNQVAGLAYALNNRANIINPSQVFLPNSPAVPGGERLLNFADFTAAAAGALGNGGRNAFIGPGFYNVDLSVARSFGLRWLGEAGRLTLRADAFNVLNHANLGNPFAQFDPTNDPQQTPFGIATFGRQGQQSGFPAVSPLNETPRQIQLSVKVTF
jgi:hypothetical protein